MTATAGSTLKDGTKTTGLNFSLLLTSHSIEQEAVMVMRHRPFEPELQKVLPWLATEKPEIFNAYQQAQGQKVENALRGAKFVASFIGHEPGRAVFVGLYSVSGYGPISFEEFWAHPANEYLKSFGMKGFTGDEGRSSILWFDLQLTSHLAAWKGKLVVDWPGLERSWWRWADRNEFAVRAILEESLFDEAMPEWERLALNWHELSALPSRWRAALSQWRGVYYIFDRTSCKGYVGSACGADNLLGRWLNYATTGHGGNKLLRGLNPEALLFTILERVPFGISAKKLSATRENWVVMVRPSLMRDYVRSGVEPNAADAWSWSVWSGYLRNDDGRLVQKWFDDGGSRAVHLHTSGHASPVDLRAFANSMQPRWLVPIHGVAWDTQAKGFPRIRRLIDGESMTLLADE